MKPHISHLCVILATLALGNPAPSLAVGTVVGWGQNSYGQATVPGGMVNIQAIAAGSDVSSPCNGFSLALKPDGTITGWGNNSYFQPIIPAAATNVIAIAAGEYHGVALRSDGKVIAWGRNSWGQTNVPAALSSNVIAIAAGSTLGDHNLALKGDGTVVGWGKNDYGQTAAPANTSNVVALAAGWLHSLALKADGTLAAWGNNGNGQINVPTSATNVLAIAAGGAVSLALRSNGTVVAWGYGSGGQTAVPASATNIVAIAAGDLHCMALRRDGTLLVWGNTNSYSFSWPANLTNVTAIASAGRHALAIQGDGSPGITVAPRNQTVYPGGSAVFQVMAAGPGNLQYQWQFNGVNLPGTTGSILTVTNAQYANSGWYQVTVRNAYGVATASAGLTLLDGRIAITQQPTNATLGVSSNVTLSVRASGAPPIKYQWNKDGSAIPGATNTSFTITNSQVADAGGYAVAFSNAFGTVWSSTGLVSVLVYPPAIKTQPVGLTVVVSSNFTLSAVAAGSPPLAYQWMKDEWLLPDRASASLTVTNAALTDGGDYRLVVTNAAGSVTSALATVVVGYPPVITTHPVSSSNSVGDTVVFTCVATGTAPIALQWLKDDAALPGATSSTLALTNVQPDQIGYYSAVATSPFGSATSSNAALVLAGYPFETRGLLAFYPFNGDANDVSGNGFNGNTNGGTAFTTNRYGQTNGALNFDGSTGFVSVGDPAGLLTFDARSNSYTVAAWVKLNSATSDRTFVIDRGTAANEACSYTLGYVPSYNRFQAGAWDTAVGIAVTNLSAPTVGRWYHLVMVVNARRVHLFVNGIEESGPEWSDGVVPSGANTTKNNEGLRNIGRFAGEGFFNYMDGAIDDVRIYNRALVASEIAQLYDMPPVLTMQPSNQVAAVGGSVLLSAAAYGSKPLRVQWSKDGQTVPDATNASLSLPNVQPADAGSYSVLVTNAYGAVTSSVASVLVVYAPGFAVQPSDTTVAAGAEVAFSCVVTGTAPIALQWFRNGTAIAGATNAVLSLTNVQPHQIGYYSVSATNLIGSAISTTATLNLAGYPFSLFNGDLALYLPFGALTNDFSGSGNHGILTGGVSTVVVEGVRTFQFDGTNGYLSTMLLQTNPQNCSLLVWFKTTTTRGGSILGLSSVQFGSGSYDRIINLNAAGQVVYYTWPGGKVEVTSPKAYNDGIWHQAAVTMSSSSGSILFMDGKPVATNVSQTAGQAYNGWWRLGFGEINAINKMYFNGYADNARVYNRVLTANDIAQLYALDLQQFPVALTSASKPSATGVFSATILGIAGRNYEVQRSDGLSPAAWTTIGTVSNAVGTAVFTDPGATNSQGTYRAWLKP